MGIGLGVAIMLLVGLLGPAAAQGTSMGIATGSEKGTYYQFGLNLRDVVRTSGIALTVHPSKGSIENIYAVYDRPNVQLGIVQSDVLAFVARVQTDEGLKRIAKKTKMVFPLYNEEVHLLGRGLKTFDDLADRRVAIGREGSGTYLTSRLLLSMSEVRPRELVPIDTDQALAELKAGRIDAMFYVAGVPVKLFADGVQPSDGLSLVPITNKSITEFYLAAEVPAGSYSWQPEPVSTVAVKSVLVSFDFRRADCDNVGRLARVVADNRSWLVANGHPKWRSVDLDQPLKGWEQYDCVRKHLGKAAESPRTPRAVSGGNPVMDVIKQVLGD